MKITPPFFIPIRVFSYPCFHHQWLFSQEKNLVSKPARDIHPDGLGLSQSSSFTSSEYKTQPVLEKGFLLQERYRIVTTLGQGGMGLVYRAWDINLKKAVALKEMRPQPGLEPHLYIQLRQQFEREARILAHLTHPNLVSVTDYFFALGNDYLVMRFVEGQSLEQRIQKEGPVPEAQLLLWAGELLDALTYCHHQGILHRDIKPANIIITPENHAVLVDFGLVKLWDPHDPRTRTVMSGMGTPAYAPPEQYGGLTEHTDQQSDLYSLGATFYHALTGKAPASASERMALPDHFIPVEKLQTRITPAVAAAITQALALPRNQRFPTAPAMKAALFGQTSPLPVPPAATPRLPWWGWGAGLLLLLLLGIGGLVALRAGRDDATPTSIAAAIPTVTVTHTVTSTPTSTYTPTPTPSFTPTETSTPVPTDLPTSTATFVPVLTYYKVPLGNQANAPLAFAPPLGGQTWAGIPFQIEPTIFKSQANGSPDSDYPTVWSAALDLTAPETLYLLLNSGNGFTFYANSIIGTVEVTCNDQNYTVAELILGRNIREWHEGDNVTDTAAAITNVWQGPVSGNVDAFLDMLTLNLPAPCRQNSLTGLTILDNSFDTIGFADPAINLVAVTVSHYTLSD